MTIFNSAIIGGRLREVRRASGRTGKEFIRIARISRAHLSKTETGVAEISVSCIEKFAAGCQMTPRALVEFLIDPHTALLADPFVAQIIPHVKRLSEYNRRIVMEVLSDLRARTPKAKRD